MTFEEGCAHCPNGGIGLRHPLYEDDLFWIVADAHPLIEGHILILPKEHASCFGALDDATFSKFTGLYARVCDFITKTYGGACVFEHGVTGQTVFHAHMHFLPFDKPLEKIIPESDSIRKIANLAELKQEFAGRGKYLYLSLNKVHYLVDVKLGFPGFFRNRIASALGKEERANWKDAKDNQDLMRTFDSEATKLVSEWRHAVPMGGYL